MAFDESTGNGMVMPVAPAYNGGNGGFGFGGDWAWILLLLVLFGGGWNNGFGGGFGGGDLYPWMNNSQHISDGFRDQMLQTSVSSIGDRITSGFGDVQNSLCSGFAGVNAAITGAQMANMQSIFGVQSALQNCCCENRAGIADLRYTVATENCADRAALSDGIREVIASQTASTQRILDQLCSDKIDAKNEKIADLERQLTMANLAASQSAQTAAIVANNEAQTTALERYLAPTPIPAYMVQNPNCCQPNFGCGCGA